MQIALAIPDLENKRWSSPVGLKGFGALKDSRCGVLQMKPGEYVSNMNV